MGFRRDGKKARRWTDWQKANAAAIREAGLPSLILETEENWTNFLTHGYYEWFVAVSNPLPWFKLEEMPEERLAALLRLVETYPGGMDTHVGRLLRERLSGGPSTATE